MACQEQQSNKAKLLKRVVFAILPGLIVAGFFAVANPTKKTSITAPVENGLVGYWNMDSNDIYGSTLYDKSGQGNHGTIYGATTGVSGKIKQALSFDGVDDYVRDSTPTGLNFVSTNQITIEAWFKLTGHSAYDGIISINDGSCAYRIMADQNLYPFYDPGAHNDQTVTTYRFTVNTWYHYAMTVQGGGNAVIYVNGASIHTSSAGVPANLPNGNDILIGTGEGPGTHPTQGLIDEVRIYNTALSLGEIQKHYAEGLGRYRLTQINK